MSKKRFRALRYDKSRIGSVPGTLNLPKHALPTHMHVFEYNENFFREIPDCSLDQVMEKILKTEDRYYWVDLQGFGSAEALSALANFYNINPLELEDVVNTYQRPKVEEYPDHLFIVAQMMYYNREHELQNEQIGFFVGKRVLVSIQENYMDCLDPVRERLRTGKSRIRTKGPDYIAYALLDVITDHYFSLLSDIGEQLESLEEKLLDNKTDITREHLLSVKRELLQIKRIVWPMRDMISTLLRDEYPWENPEMKMYYRDLYDHAIQVMDLNESYREVAASLMDLYMSSISNRMNEIMKVLTIISTIFIPLSFIAGIYGMNFSHTDANGKPLPYNMPELLDPYGYVYFWILISLVTIVMLVYFFRKGWFK